MLSSVLNNRRAIEVNIAIMRTFTVLRKMLLLQKDIMQEFSKIRKQLADQDNTIMLILEYLKQFEESRQQQEQQENHKRIGF